MKEKIFMIEKWKVEVFSAVNDVACSSCDINILDMQYVESADRANRLGVVSVPAIVINGKLAG